MRARSFMTVPATDVSGRGWLSRCGCRLLRSLLFARAPRGNASRNLRADRDVLVNLRVVSDAARLAEADGHVCELQLVLRAFDELRCGVCARACVGR